MIEYLRLRKRGQRDVFVRLFGGMGSEMDLPNSRKLWERFKLRVGARAGLRALSQAVEALLEEGVAERVVAEEPPKMLAAPAPLGVKPVKPKVPTDAGRAVRELRRGGEV
jgi:hypothetical protein